MGIDWNTIDWDKVGEKKALFIYHEAVEAQREVVSELNAMTSKAYGLLALVVPVQVATLAGVFTWWDSLPGHVKASGVVFSAILFISVFCLSLAVVPRRITWASNAPAPYFHAHYYKRSLARILHGNIEGAQRDIEVNRNALQVRSYWFRRGLVVMIFSFIPTIATFVFTIL